MGDGIRRESGETLRKISLSSSRKQVGRSYTCRSPFLASRSLSTLSCSKENSSSSFLSTSLPFPLPLLLSPLSLYPFCFSHLFPSLLLYRRDRRVRDGRNEEERKRGGREALPNFLGNQTLGNLNKE